MFYRPVSSHVFLAPAMYLSYNLNLSYMKMDLYNVKVKFDYQGQQFRGNVTCFFTVLLLLEKRILG